MPEERCNEDGQHRTLAISLAKARRHHPTAAAPIYCTLGPGFLPAKDRIRPAQPAGGRSDGHNRDLDWLMAAMGKASYERSARGIAPAHGTIIGQPLRAYIAVITFVN
jgi:hypothetical protein